VVCQEEWAAWVEWVAWECNTIPVQNTLRTRVKQIRNPQKEISGGFFYSNQKELILEVLFTNKLIFSRNIKNCF